LIKFKTKPTLTDKTIKHTTYLGKLQTLLEDENKENKVA